MELHTLATEGATEGWAATPDPTSLTQILMAADHRSAATTRLDELMRTMAITRPKRPTRRWWIAGIVGCALLGAALAIATGPRSLWAGAKVGPPKEDSVWGQLYQAKDVDTETAWRAVKIIFRMRRNTHAISPSKGWLTISFIRRNTTKRSSRCKNCRHRPSFIRSQLQGWLLCMLIWATTTALSKKISGSTARCVSPWNGNRPRWRCC